VTLTATGGYRREVLRIKFFTEDGEDEASYLLHTEKKRGRLLARFVPYRVNPDTNVPLPELVGPDSHLFNEAEMAKGEAYLSIHREHPFYPHVLGALTALADAHGRHVDRFVDQCNEGRNGNVL